MLTYSGIALFVASVAVGHVGGEDDWATFDHRSFRVTAVTEDGLRIAAGNRTVDVKVLGVRADGAVWQELVGRPVTLLLTRPQTRDGDRLRAHVFVDGKNVAVETVKAGAGWVNRTDAGDYIGALNPAQADAKKHRRGVWATPLFSDKR